MLDDLPRRTHEPRRGARAAQGLDIDQLLGGAGGLAAGAAAASLAGVLLGGGKPKKLAKSALKIGGVALVGGLAYKAWRDWQANKPGPQSMRREADHEPEAFIPQAEDERILRARALMRAMIAAAKADGRITDQERTRILDECAALDVDQEARDFIRSELERPVDVDAIVREARTPEIAAELYAASLLAVDPNGQAEAAYLAFLAARLRLDSDLIDRLHSNVIAAESRDAA